MKLLVCGAGAGGDHPGGAGLGRPHAGHFVQEEAPDELGEAVIPFLDEPLNRLDEDQVSPRNSAGWIFVL